MRKVANPSRAAKPHLEESHKNYRRYELLQSAGETEWALVLLFYSAVPLLQSHAVHAAGTAGANSAPKSHEQRLDYAYDHCGSIFNEYRILYEKSRDVRYDLVKMTDADLLTYHDTEFRKIRQYLELRGFLWPVQQQKVVTSRST